MTTFLTSQLARIAEEIDSILRRKLTAEQASQWMLSANASFGGFSPIQIIKLGRGDEVRELALTLVADAEYDADEDIRLSVQEGLRAVKRRMMNGGKPWP